MGKKGFIFLISVIVIIVVVVVSMLITQKSKEIGLENRQEVTLAYIPFTSCLQLFVALEKGYFTDEGLVVKPQQCANSNVALDALMSGSVQGSIGNGFTTLLPIEQAAPGMLKVYHPCLETEKKYSSNVLVPINSPFKMISDLKGHIIGTYTGATQRINLLLILRKFMNPEKDIRISQVSSSLQIQALQAKQFDALFTIEPQSTIVLDRKIGRILESNVRVKYILNPYPAAANSFMSEYVNHNPKTVAKIVRALDRAILYIRENETEARRCMPKYLPMEQNVALQCGIYEWQQIKETDSAIVQKLADLMVETGELKTKIDVNSLFIHERDTGSAK